MNKILGITSFFVLTGLAAVGIYFYLRSEFLLSKNEAKDENEVLIADESRAKRGASEDAVEVVVTPTPILTPTPTPVPLALPDAWDLDIPFITQAPFRSWKECPFNHNCEEASILQVYYYFEKKQPTDESKIRQELLDMVDFETKNYGFHEDTSASQTARLIKDYYGYDVRVYYDVSAEDIKKELVKGNPVIIPAAGRLLGNPNFTPPGPLFHMLVVKGYSNGEFITNDPGTYRTGANWRYSEQVLENALHDWNDGDVLNGKSAMIVIYPPN